MARMAPLSSTRVSHPFLPSPSYAIQFANEDLVKLGALMGTCMPSTPPLPYLPHTSMLTSTNSRRTLYRLPLRYSSPPPPLPSSSTSTNWSPNYGRRLQPPQTRRRSKRIHSLPRTIHARLCRYIWVWHLPTWQRTSLFDWLMAKKIASSCPSEPRSARKRIQSLWRSLPECALRRFFLRCSGGRVGEARIEGFFLILLESDWRLEKK